MRQATGAAILAVALGHAGALLAETQRLQNDFTFRRVGVPETGTTNRINVQIDPNSTQRVRPPVSPDAPPDAGSAAVTPASAPGGAQASPAPAGFEWFWETISPARSDSRPGRLEDAVNLLTTSTEGQALARPRVQTLAEIAAAHGPDILRASVGTKVSPALVLAVIAVESAGRTDAVSTAGAAGLMQLMPATAERFGVTDRLVAAENIAGGVAYLDWLIAHFDGDPILALAGYNAGEGAVRDNGGVPPYAETRGYVPKVIAAWTVARGLCQTPPDLMTDGCVFTVNNL
jgi:soluble lytic murein transglycosylase-like protein